MQRFASLADLAAAECTIEEREEYEPHIAAGNVVYAGVDYRAIVQAAEREADILVWDGGNNDFPFLRPDLHIVIADALRPGQATTHHPGEAVLRMADVIVVNKVNSASSGQVERVVGECRAVNPSAVIVQAASAIRLDDASAVRGRRVLVVEDGPTITHGGMPTGAGFAAAMAVGADSRRSAQLGRAGDRGDLSPISAISAAFCRRSATARPSSPRSSRPSNASQADVGRRRDACRPRQADTELEADRAGALRLCRRRRADSRTSSRSASPAFRQKPEGTGAMKDALDVSALAGAP